MLTKKDVQLIQGMIDESKVELRSEILSFKDEILHEIRGMREELTIVIGYRQHIADHDDRIERIEHHLGFSS
jgi:hypothetical protein